MTQHATLDVERWATFNVDRQLLMIANEMNRARRFVDRSGLAAARRGYERVLRLTDLTVATGPRPALLRELLRWRDVVAGLYCAPATDPALHRAALRALLQLGPTPAQQISLLGLGPAPRGSDGPGGD